MADLISRVDPRKLQMACSIRDVRSSHKGLSFRSRYLWRHWLKSSRNFGRANQFLILAMAFSTKLKSKIWPGGTSLVTPKLFLVKSMAPRIQASSK